MASKSDDVENTSASKSASTTSRFRWGTGDKIENLIRCLGNYKTQMEYKHLDFNADKVQQYEAVREAMARIYEYEPTLFGPPAIRDEVSDKISEEERAGELEKQQKNDKELIKKGYTRIQEKIKEIRQSFSTAITTGSRSGSGRLVMEYYDQLKLIWGGSPSTEPLVFGITTDDVTEELDTDDGLTELESDKTLDTSTGSESESVATTDTTNKKSKKGKRTATNPAPRLIDNKRKHLERKLSASQRDQMLLDESKEDSVFKKEIADAITQSNETFAQSMQQMSESMREMTKGLTQSFQFMARAMLAGPTGQPPAYGYPNQVANHSMRDPRSSFHEHAGLGMTKPDMQVWPTYDSSESIINSDGAHYHQL